MIDGNDADTVLSNELRTVCTPLKTNAQRWSMLIATSCASALAAGPVNSWPTLEPLLEGAGLFAESTSQQSNLSSVYAVATACGYFSTLFSGLLYDRLGGCAVACVGALIASVGLLLMAVASYLPSQLSVLMYVGYPIATVGGLLNSYGIFVFMWVFPERQVCAWCQRIANACVAVYLYF